VTHPFAGSALKGRVVLSRAARGAAIGGRRALGLGRLGQPRGVACEVVFLCAAACSLIAAVAWAVGGRVEV
jgi:hypothetical protein